MPIRSGSPTCISVRATNEGPECILRGPQTRPTRRWPLKSSPIVPPLARSGSGGAQEDAKLRERLADALSHAGRSAEAAIELLRAAAATSSEESAIELRCRAAIRYLTSGHIDDGLVQLAGVLKVVGIKTYDSRWTAIASLLWQRCKLWFRPFKYTPRKLEEMPAKQRMLLDVCWSAAAGLSVIDPIRAADYVTRNVLLAMDAGDQRYLVALAAQTCHMAVAGRRSARVVKRYLRYTRQVAAAYGHPYGRASLEMARGCSAHLQGRWRTAQTSSDRAVAYLTDFECRDVAWELDTARTFAMWSLMYMGEVAELTRRQPNLLRIARKQRSLRGAELRDDRDGPRLFGGRPGRRGPPPAPGRPGAFVAPGVFRAASQLAARQDFRRTLCGRPRRCLADDRPRLARLCGVNAGNGPASPDRFPPDQREGSGRRGGDPRQKQEHVRSARSIIRKLQGERTLWAGGLASAVQAGLENVVGNPVSAASLLEQAAGRLFAADMRLFAAAARRHLGVLRRSDELVSEADSLMRQLGIANPRRMAACSCPALNRPSREIKLHGNAAMSLRDPVSVPRQVEQSSPTGHGLLGGGRPPI